MGRSADSAPGARGRSWAVTGQTALDRIGSYFFIYVAVAIFALLYVFSVKGAERALGLHFEVRVADALQVTDFRTSVATTIQQGIRSAVRDSRWVSWGGVRASVIAIGRDGRTLIYVGGAGIPPPGSQTLLENMREAERLLPATAQVSVSVPHNTVLSNAILLLYAGGWCRACSSTTAR